MTVEPRAAGGLIRRAVGLCLAGIVGTGCAHYHARPLSPAATLDDFEARRLDAPALREFLRAQAGVPSWPLESWNLRALTLAAFFYSPELDLARARWAVAAAGALTAGAHPDPSLNAALGYNSSAAAGVARRIPEIALGLPIETAGKRGFRLARARHLAEAARLDVLSTAWRVRSRLRGALLDLLVARQTASLLEDRQQLQAESVRLLELRLGVGEVSPNEVSQARIASAENRLAALDAGRRSAQARVRLAEALGVPTGALDAVTLSFDAFDHVALELPSGEIRRRALVSRSDILGALAEYEASQSALQLEVAKQYPDLNLGPGYQLDQTDSKWTLALGLTLPLFNRNKGPIAEAEAQRAETAARFLALQAKVVSEIEQALGACRAAAAGVSAADALRANIEQRLASTESARRLGEISKLELVGVRLELAASELARLEATARAQQAVGELENAMQSPLDVREWVLKAPRSASRQEGRRDE